MSETYEEYNEEDEGIHFGPSDEELINAYLIPKLRGDDRHDDFIVPKNVYAKEPWLLDHTKDPFFKQNEWFYFVTRTKVSKNELGCGKKAKRKIAGDNNIERGNWKANATAEIKDSKTGKVIGKKQNLTYTISKNNKKQKGAEGTSVVVPGSNDSWIMTEYMLPDEGDKFQDRVLCKISTVKRSKNKDEASTSSSFSEQQPINEMNKSKKEEDQLQINVPPVSLGQVCSLPIVLGEEPKDWNPSLGCRVEEVNDVRVSNDHVSVQDPLSESVLHISSERDEQVKNVEVTHEAEKGLEGALKINTENQQPARPISASTQMNVSLARFGDKSLPIVLDDDSNEDAPPESTKEWVKDLEKFLDDDSNEDAPFEATQERVKELEKLLLTENGPGLPVGEDEEEVLLIYNTPIIDQDLWDQCDALRLTRTSQTC